MNDVIFLRHFRTKIDKTLPVDQWGLDEEGTKAMENLLETYDFSGVRRILTSPEPKAKITGDSIARRYNIPVEELDDLKEVDRSAQGFIEGDYAAVVKRYFNENAPDIRWEPLSSVRQRIQRAMDRVTAEDGKVMVISHGMFMTLMLAPIFNKDLIDFWKDLGFGEVLNVDRSHISEVWNDDDTDAGDD